MQNLRFGLNLALGLLAFCFFTGCATPALWEDDAFLRFHEPAQPAKLRVYKDPAAARALVVYEEQIEEREGQHERAYWLDPTVEPRANPRREKFVRLKRAEGLSPVPVGAEPAAAGWSAVVGTNNAAFALYADGTKMGAYELPVYPAAFRRTKQVLLTPFAVILDSTIVGGWIAVIVAASYRGGFDF